MGILSLRKTIILYYTTGYNNTVIWTLSHPHAKYSATEKINDIELG